MHRPGDVNSHKLSATGEESKYGGQEYEYNETVDDGVYITGIECFQPPDADKSIYALTLYFSDNSNRHYGPADSPYSLYK